ncbi:FMN-binding protein [Labilibacter marinus]|uniref:FMN-binding protein n=1 Tax=Labilibacter marinus TaxID=1477105 RepID=UPI0008343C66|nr:FMN-binding protein [Labilibacter marinus]
MNKKILLVLLLAFNFTSSYITAGDLEINYSHRSLIKELEKQLSSDTSALTEIKLTEAYYKGKFYELNGSNESFVYIGRVNSCRAGGCAISSENKGPSEYFDYFIFFDKTGQVTFVKIFNYAATHGHEVMAKGWLKQYRGYSSKKNLEVGKEVDTISGATISVNAITEDIKIKTTLLSNYLEK